MEVDLDLDEVLLDGLLDDERVRPTGANHLNWVPDINGKVCLKVKALLCESK